MSQSNPQQQLPNFTSGKDSNISRRRNRTEAPSLRQPVVPAKRPIAPSDLSSDSDDQEDYAIDTECPHQQNHNSQIPIWAASMSFFRTKDTAAESTLHENGGMQSENDNQSLSQNTSSDEDNHWPKRRKIAATANGIDKFVFDRYVEDIPNPCGSQSPDKSSVGNSAKPHSSRTFEDESLTLGKTNTSPEMSINTADTIGTQVEDYNNGDGMIGTSPLEDRKGFPATSKSQTAFSEVATKMRTSYMARHSATGPMSHRWIKNPTDTSGPPIREKPKARRRSDNVYFTTGESNGIPVWRLRSARNVDKTICIVEDIPVLVATAHCDPIYSNEKQLITTLMSGYTGFRKEEIEWCLVGVRGEKTPVARKNQIFSQRDEDEAMVDCFLPSNQHGISRNNCISPPQSQDNSILREPEQVLYTTSSSLSSPALTESSLPKINFPAHSSTNPQRINNNTVASITNTPITTLTDLAHAYSTSTYENYATQLNRLSTILLQATEKHLNLNHRMHSLPAEISDLSTTITLLRGRLTGLRKESIGLIFDEEKVEKEAELVAVGNSIERVEREIEDLKMEMERVKGERRAFVMSAKEMRDEVESLLWWVDVLGAEEDNGEDERKELGENEKEGDGDEGNEEENEEENMEENMQEEMDENNVEGNVEENAEAEKEDDDEGESDSDEQIEKLMRRSKKRGTSV